MNKKYWNIIGITGFIIAIICEYGYFIFDAPLSIGIAGLYSLIVGMWAWLRVDIKEAKDEILEQI